MGMVSFVSLFQFTMEREELTAQREAAEKKVKELEGSMADDKIKVQELDVSLLPPGGIPTEPHPLTTFQ